MTPDLGLKLSSGTIRDENPTGRRLSVKSNVAVARSTSLSCAEAVDGTARIPAATSATTTVRRKARIATSWWRVLSGGGHTGDASGAVQNRASTVPPKPLPWSKEAAGIPHQSHPAAQTSRELGGSPGSCQADESAWFCSGCQEGAHSRSARESLFGAKWLPNRD